MAHTHVIPPQHVRGEPPASGWPQDGFRSQFHRLLRALSYRAVAA